MVTRILALIGLAAVIGGVHSLFVPVRLSRQGGGALPAGLLEAPAAEGDGRPGAGDGGADSPGPGAEPGEGGDGEAAGGGKVSLEAAARLHERAMAGEAVVFLDARLESDYEAGHIAGALLMPHTRVSGGDGLDELAMYASPGEGAVLVIYCTGGDCEASEDTAILLEAAGYTRIVIMSAGYEDWAAAGLAVEAGGARP